MVIDFHTHIFPEKIAARTKQILTENCLRYGNELYPCTELTLESLIEHMNMWGVDISVVMPIATNPAQTEHLNRFAAEVYERSKGRLISFGSVHPASDNIKRDIDFVVSLGLKGIKLHAEYQQFSSDEERMLRLYDYAFEKGLIILHHAGADKGMPPPYYTTPKQLAHVLDEMKGGVMIAAHFGGHDMWDDVEKYLVGRDIYFDTSMGQRFYSREQFERIVNNHGADKILFASDSPWSKAGDEIKLINETSLTEEQKELIFSGNAKRLLNI